MVLVLVVVVLGPRSGQGKKGSFWGSQGKNIDFWEAIDIPGVLRKSRADLLVPKVMREYRNRWNCRCGFYPIVFSYHPPPFPYRFSLHLISSLLSSLLRRRRNLWVLFLFLSSPVLSIGEHYCPPPFLSSPLPNPPTMPIAQSATAPAKSSPLLFTL